MSYSPRFALRLRPASAGPPAVVSGAPDAEPLAWEELRDHMRLDGDTDKAYVEALEQVARDAAETATGRAFITQTWQLLLDCWPCDNIIEISKCPVQSIDAITYVDTAGVTQTLDPALYQTDLASEPARIMPAYGQYWPTLRDVPNAVMVEFTAGYGDDGSTVPEGIKHAIKFLASHLYENREPVVQSGGAGLTAEMPLAFTSLLFPFRVF